MKCLNIIFKVFLTLLMPAIFWGTANAMIDTPKYDHPDKTIIVDPVSPQFEIVQNANATTGYSWVLREYDKRLLKLVNSGYIPSRSQLAGAGGKMIWVFRATPEAFQQETTETKILLTYARSWAPDDHPASVEFKVVFNQKSPEVRIMN